MKFSEYVLLTGAGFTANFNAPLASEVHNQICNHDLILADPQLKELAENMPNFEQFYCDVINGDYSPSQKKAVNSTISEAYRDIDERLRNLPAQLSNGLSVLRTQDFIGCFKGVHKQPGMIFTLNQDLFLERHYYNLRRPYMPGIPSNLSWFDTTATNAPFSTFQVDIPNNTGFRSAPMPPNLLYYVKLHGSCNWSSAVRSQQMVIGTDKSGRISEEPLLAWYFKLFEDCLLEDGKKLLCLGYSFSDDHINLVIANAIKDANLELHIMSPQPRNEFTKKLRNRQSGVTITTGIKKYYQHTLVEICQRDGHMPSEWGYLCDNLFGGNFKNCMGAVNF